MSCCSGDSKKRKIEDDGSVLGTDEQKKIDAYYTEIQNSKELKTSACTSPPGPPYVKTLLSKIHPEILSSYYGCGTPIPEALAGATVLDIGCGTGRDVFLLSALVGQEGKVIGVDALEKQLTIARRHADNQAKAFGFSKSNTEFIQGRMEDMSAVASGSVDVVTSNCVINLSTNKPAVLKEIARVLKPGGELHFSDVYSSRRLTKEARENQVMLGECLGGALYTEDFRRHAANAGFIDVRVVEERELSISDESLLPLIGAAKFYSRTIRAFKLKDLEDRCEDYGQVAIYKGGIVHAEQMFHLDLGHSFEAKKPMLVCGNTAAMLKETRFAPFFEVIGDRSIHYGIFESCGSPTEINNKEEIKSSCC